MWRGLDSVRVRASTMNAFLLRGLGFLAAAYDVSVMVAVDAVLREEFVFTVAALSSAEFASSGRDVVLAAGLAGAVVGQLGLGMLGDVVGRRGPMIATSALLVLGASLSAAAYASGTRHLLVFLAIARAVTGLGVGGEFPLAATATAEDAASSAERTARVLDTFALQGAAWVASAFLGNLLVQALAMDVPGENDRGGLNFVWRLLLALGAVPAAVVGYYRITVSAETTAFKSARDKGLVDHSHGTTSILRRHSARLSFIARYYALPLIGCAGTWFVWGVLSTAPTLLARHALVVLRIVAEEDEPPLQLWTAVNACMALLALPGYAVATAAGGRVGRRRLQLQGFALLSVLFVLLASLWDEIKSEPPAFVVLVALVLFFGNCGPNATTFALPTEMFPPAIGCTCFGVAAAAGHVGMAVGHFLVPSGAVDDVPIACFTFAALSVLGAVLTWFCCFDCDLSFEERDEQFERRLLDDDHGRHLAGRGTRAALMITGDERRTLPPELPGHIERIRHRVGGATVYEAWQTPNAT